MFNTAKKTQLATEDSQITNRRKVKDRRKSKEDVRFPFIDDEHKLVMKDRRVSKRRVSDENISDKSLKAIGKILKK